MPTAESFPDPQQLLEAAELLSSSGTHPGHWRRSISTSYYAAFHSITGEGSRLIFTEDVVAWRGRRWFKHGAMAAVAQAVQSATAEQDWRKLGFTDRPSDPIRGTCRLFVGLQTRREDADYASPMTGPPRSTEANKALADARSICDDVAQYSSSPVNPEFVVVVAEMMSRSVERSRH